MKRGVLLFGVWVAATLAVGAVAMLVVGSAGEQVAEDAVIPLSASEVEALRTSTTVPAEPGSGTPAVPTSTSSVPDTSQAAPTSGPTTTGAAPSSTVPDPVSTTVVSTTAGETTTTTASSWQSTAHTVSGGTVVIRFDGSRVELVSATPNPGFAVEIEASGPDKVAVEFEGEDASSHFEAEMSGGELVISRQDDD